MSSSAIIWVRAQRTAAWIHIARRRCPLLLLATLASFGCGDGSTALGPPPEALNAKDPSGRSARSINIVPSSGTLRVGESLQLTAEVLDHDGLPMSLPITWSSTHEQTASVSFDGVLSAHAPGFTLVRAIVDSPWGPVTGRASFGVEESSEPANHAPDPPSLSVSAIGTDAATLNGSAFSDLDEGNTHAASRWQVDLSGGDYSSPVFDSGETTSDLLTRTVTGLAASTAYEGRVRYRDNVGGWSDWSAPQSFTTTTPNSPPATPTVVTVSGITTSGATLTGSSFSDPDAGNTHASTQWQVDVAAGDYSSPVFDSGEGTSNLTTGAVTGLAASTEYQARVRYKDNADAWSAWSVPKAFTTAAGNSPPSAPTLTTSNLTSTSVTLNGTAFSDPDAGNTHDASEWQMDEDGGDWSTIVATSGVTTNPD
jgi:hypothetical protein